jgi:hypothetical protein
MPRARRAQFSIPKPAIAALDRRHLDHPSFGVVSARMMGISAAGQESRATP